MMKTYEGNMANHSETVELMANFVSACYKHGNKGVDYIMKEQLIGALQETSQRKKYFLMEKIR